jgi:site-specific DNA recombinase
MNPEEDQYAGYIRVSTEDQADNGVSLDAQRALITSYATSNGINVVSILEDAGASAKSLKRPGMQRVIQFLESGGNGLLIAKLDRLTRSLSDWLKLSERFFGPASGKTLYSISQPVDLQTAQGRMVANILMSVAQQERELVVERTETAMDHKRSKGHRLGTIPFGKMLDPDGKTLVPCPVEVNALAFMDGLAKAGSTLKDIATELDCHGFPTRSGRPWSTSTISKLLHDHETKE